jgi:hypothetical protein
MKAIQLVQHFLMKSFQDQYLRARVIKLHAGKKKEEYVSQLKPSI